MTDRHHVLALREAIRNAPHDDWRGCSVQHGCKCWKAEALAIPFAEESACLRIFIAMQILREFSGNQYDAAVLLSTYGWIDGGMNGHVPWPENPFFAHWAASQGYAKVDGFVRFQQMAKAAG